MGQPKLYIADEPTTALDVTVQRQIFDLVRQVNRDEGAAVLLISHDVAAVAELCHRIVVMYAGRIVEEADVATVLGGAAHPYTRALVAAVPHMTIDRAEPLATIPGRPPDPRDVGSGCPFAPRCPFADDRCRAEMPTLDELADGWRAACWHPPRRRGRAVRWRRGAVVSLLSVRDVSVRYGEGRRSITAVDHVSLELPDGAVVGLVGESGSGKSTLAKAIVGLQPLTHGSITLDGDDIAGPGRQARERRRRVQMVFQDPYSSLDPRMTVGDSLVEALTVRRPMSRAQRRHEIERMLDLVSLDADVAVALPRHLSGGQLQRVSIARALAADPRLLIADEITSSLDVSVQGAVLNVVRDVRAALGLSMLFISHNVAVVRYISDIVAVMYLGQIVEVGTTDEVLTAPRHPFTKILLDSVPGDRSRWTADVTDRRRTARPRGAAVGVPLPPALSGRAAGPAGADDLHDGGPLRRCRRSGEPGGVPLRRRAL